MSAMAGRFFEDFVVGDTYRSRLGRTVTDTDNTWFTLLTNNTNQLHFNEHYAALTPFGRPLVNSALTIAIVAGLGVADTSENGFALGWDEITLPNPLYAGDTLYSESTVLRKRETESRQDAGIVTFRTRGIKQTGHVVLEYTRSVMVFKRAHAPVVDAFPEPLVDPDDKPVRDRD
jgi:acyl dehydratase